MIKPARAVSVKEEPMDKIVNYVKTHHGLCHVQEWCVKSLGQLDSTQDLRTQHCSAASAKLDMSSGASLPICVTRALPQEVSQPCQVPMDLTTLEEK